jgi:hypothetical protein
MYYGKGENGSSDSDVTIYRVWNLVDERTSGAGGEPMLYKYIHISKLVARRIGWLTTTIN